MAAFNELSVLHIENAQFKKWAKSHDTKIMFRFAFEASTITLTGWAPKRNDDDDDYDEENMLELTAGSEKEKLEGTRLYFGNLRVSQAIVQIMKKIPDTARFKYFLFIPKNYHKYPEQIMYEIFVSPTTESKDKIPIPDFLTAPAADPSPPATRK